MKTTFTFFCLFLFFSAQSQIVDTVKWCPAGATWIYTKNTGNIMGFASTSIDYNKYVYEKDTLINNINFKKINQFSFSDITEIYPENGKIFLTEDRYNQSIFLHQSNDSIFYLNDNDSLTLLYSFNTVINEKWETLQTNISFIDQYPLNCDTIVSDIDTIVVVNKNSETINDIIFNYDQTTSKLDEWKLGRIYKNIGSNSSFFSTPLMQYSVTCETIVDANEGYNKEISLVVYYDDIREYSFNSNYQSAYYLMTDIGKVTEDYNLKIFPNPTKQYLTITNQNYKDKLQIELYNISGQIVYSSTLNSSRERLNLENIGLSKGTYFVKLVDKKKILVSKLIYK